MFLVKEIAIVFFLGRRRFEVHNDLIALGLVKENAIVFDEGTRHCFFFLKRRRFEVHKYFQKRFSAKGVFSVQGILIFRNFGASILQKSIFPICKFFGPKNPLRPKLLLEFYPNLDSDDPEGDLRYTTI